MGKLTNLMQVKADAQFKKFNCNWILTDLKIDFDSLATTQGKKFIWVIRDMGTQLFDIAELALIKSSDHIVAVHTIQNWQDSYKVYILDITKQTLKPGTKSDLEKILLKSRSKSKNVLVRYKSYGEIYHKTINVITSYPKYATDYAEWQMERKFGVSSDEILEMIETK